MDEKIDNMIKEIFKSLETIDQVLIVVKSSLNRLIQNEKYCCEMISRLYGKDIKDRITGMISWYDGSETIAATAMLQANIEFRATFKFNNASNFTSNREHSNQLQYTAAKQEFKKFCVHIKENGRFAMPLSLTKKQLDARRQIEKYSQDARQHQFELYDIIRAVKQSIKEIRHNYKAINGSSADF